MKKGFSILMVLFISFELNAQWVDQTSGVSANLVSVSAVDNNVCWISGDGGVVLRTTNGGTTWANVGGGPVIGIENTVDNVYALDANTCIVSAYSFSGATFVYRTTNGGNNWTQVFAQNPGLIDAICMTSAVNGFMVGDPSNSRWSLWKTSNGGAKWDSTGLYLMASGGENGWNNSLYINGSNIWFGTNNSKIYYSSDDGAKWTAQINPVLNVHSLSFSGNIGIASGSSTSPDVGAISISTNNGTTWTSGPFRGSGFANCTAQGNNFLYTTQTGAIYLSTNSGISFTDVDSVSGNTYYDIGIARNGTTAWACGIDGTIRNSTILQLPTEGLQLWVRADKGVVLNGPTVSRWIDQSGNGNDAIQNDTSRQPIFVSNKLNHNPILRFDGVNDRLGLTGTRMMNSISLFIVEKADQGATGPNPYYPIEFGIPRPPSGNNPGARYGLSMQNQFSNPPNSPDEIDPFEDGDSWVRANSPACAAFGQWKSISVTANQYMWSTTLRVNGVDAAITPQGTVNTLLNFPLGNSTGTAVGGIGGIDGESEGHLIFKGDIAEVIVYDTVLSNADRKTIENYLKSKYLLPYNTTAINDIKPVIKGFSLEQNYPNPFNPSTTINYTIAKPDLVKIAVYNTLGQKIKELVNEVKGTGSYSISFNASSISSGIYFYKIETSEFSQVKKMILLK
jgi:photosystem II stability/assembly factor-like uncharacterized protein